MHKHLIHKQSFERKPLETVFLKKKNLMCLLIIRDFEKKTSEKKKCVVRKVISNVEHVGYFCNLIFLLFARL